MKNRPESTEQSAQKTVLHQGREEWINGVTSTRFYFRFWRAV